MEYKEFRDILESRIKELSLWYMSKNKYFPRTSEIRPNKLFEEVYWDKAHKEGEEYTKYTDALYLEIVREMETQVENTCQRRRFILQNLEKAEFIPDGKILLYDPLRTLNDRLAEEASKGFFDEYNCPGWDSWICFVMENKGKGNYWKTTGLDGGYLVSWIPTPLIKLVDNGVKANLEDCIIWAEDFVQEYKNDKRFSDLFIMRYIREK